MENEKGKVFITLREASNFTGIGVQTLRKLGDNKQIECYKTPSGQRKFNKQCLEKMCNINFNDEEVQEDKRQNYIYARVSSKKQMDDLSRQVEYIRNKRPEYSTYIFVTDIASGINFKRRGLSTILDACVQKSIGDVVVAHKDRLSRFGFDLIKLFIEKSGGKVTVLDDEKNKSSEQELSEDLLSIIHVFSCKQMGKRSYKTRKNSKGVENNIESITQTT